MMRTQPQTNVSSGVRSPSNSPNHSSGNSSGKFFRHLLEYTLDYLLPWLALPILLLYTYLELAHAPYIGFAFSPSRGTVEAIFVDAPTYDLQAGDTLLAVNGVGWHDERVELHNTLLSYLNPGDVIDLAIEREGEIRSTTWQVPGFTVNEFMIRLVNVWVLGYVFWLAGTATSLLVRPRDERSRLFTAFFVLTAVWLVAGNTGRWNLWNSTNLFRSAIWLCVPVYLHLHWLIPKQMVALPALFWRIFYAMAALVAVAQWFEAVPRNLYGVALLVALVGSAILLIIHYVRQPAQRSQIRFLTFAFLFAIIPLIGLGIVSVLGSIPPQALLALGSLPLIPGAYFYTIYRYQLGGLEFRANQLLSLYLFLLLLGSLLAVLFAIIGLLPEWVSKDLLAGVTLSLVAALLGIYAFPLFQRFIEARLLGISLPSARLLETYVAHITTSLTQSDLAHLLEEEILPSLMIRQSALLVVEGQRLTPLYVSGVEAELLPTELAAVSALAAQNFQDASTPVQPGEWVRAAVPLRFEERLVGLWLFGRRDPDDSYRAAELSVLQTLAHQTAIALVNIEQSQQLRALYDANVERHESERTHLARELHDDILGGLSVLKAAVPTSGPANGLVNGPANMRGQEPQSYEAQGARFEKAYQDVKQRIIHMITGLRPAMLNYGLYAALEELTDDLNERTYAELERKHPLAQLPGSKPESELESELDDAASKLEPGSDPASDPASGTETEESWLTLVSLELEPALVMLPPKVEEYLFRIVQQACENALRHSHARTVCIIGSIANELVDLAVVDDGVGFDFDPGHSYTTLLAEQHFGLVGMMERSRSLGAELSVESQPGEGTSIRVLWKANQVVV